MINAFQAMEEPKYWNGWLDLKSGDKGWEEAQANNPFFIGIQKLLSENVDWTGGSSLATMLFLLDAPVEMQNFSSDFKLRMKFELHRESVRGSF